MSNTLAKLPILGKRKVRGGDRKRDRSYHGYSPRRREHRTGTWLLLIGGIVLAVSLKIYTDLRSRIEEPDKLTEELLRARANSQYWLMMAGGLILGLSLVAAFLTNDFLTEYQEMGVVAESPVPGSGVEVIEVFPGPRDPAGETGDSTELVEVAHGLRSLLVKDCLIPWERLFTENLINAINLNSSLP